MIKIFSRILLIFMVLGVYVACTKHNFKRDLCEDTSSSCEENKTGLLSLKDSFIVDNGLVDILFVIDNSGSMSFEHTEIANKFPNFLQSIEHLDYRIAVTTTDIMDVELNAPRTINDSGSLQDGNLISFGNGALYLTPEDSDKETLFQNTIRRQETLTCEAFLRSDQAKSLRLSNNYNDKKQYRQLFSENCPSSDERGIYAARLAIEKNIGEFIRSNAHLAVIIISDEDERGLGRESFSPYKLEDNDMPENLVSYVESQFGGSKTFSAHSIIVKFGDNSCLVQQQNQLLDSSGQILRNQKGEPLIRGRAGALYEELSQLTGGVIGSICSANYGQQLGEIGFSISQDVNSFQISDCNAPTDVIVDITPNSAGITYHLDGSQVFFSESLPPGTQVSYSYTCNKN